MRRDGGVALSIAECVRRILLALLVLFASFAGPTFTFAQTAPKTGQALLEQQKAALDGLASQTDALERLVALHTSDDAALVNDRQKLEEIARNLLDASVAFRPRLAEINERLDRLGPPPAQGAPPEAEIVVSERSALAAEKAQINATLGLAEDLSIRVNNLVAHITDLRRDLFSRLLTKKYDIDLTLVGEVDEAVKGMSGRLQRAMLFWWRGVLSYKLNSVFAITVFALVAAFFLRVGARRQFGHLFSADPEQQEPSYLSRLSVAFWSTAVPSAVLAVFLGATFFFLDYFQMLPQNIRPMLAALFGVIGLVFFIYRLGKAVLSPHLPEWRLIPVESGAALKLHWIMFLAAALSGLDYLLSVVYDTLDAPLALTVGEALVATILIGLLVIRSGLVKPFVDAEGKPRPWPSWLRFFLYSLGCVTILAAVLGYIGMARFISQQIVWTGAILTMMYIGFLSARAVTDEGAFADTTVGRRLQHRFALDETGLDQVSLVISLLINAVILLVGVPFILFQWGFRLADINAWLYRAATGIQIGSLTISLTGVLWGLGIFAVGFALTRWFQRWLDEFVLTRGRVDAGVRNSIRTVVGYGGLALAGLLGLSAAGINFSNLALIAGGLSLGIGFGLQNIVSNFVSGLILLAERPFKAGDWVVAGTVSGIVKKVSVRATEIETFQRQTVIMPNSELINASVGNWTHRNKLGRMEISVGVAYGTDARKAHAILLEIATSHPRVLKNPEPFVAFTAFADTAMTFELRVFLGDIGESGIVQNDLRFAILDAFARESIEIPYSRRHVHLPEGESSASWRMDDEAAEAALVESIQRRETHLAEIKTRKRNRRRRPDPE